MKAEAVGSEALTGGGSLPGAEIPSWGVALTHPERSSDDLAAALRYGSTPVIGRIEGARLLLDVRTVPPGNDETLVALVVSALRSP